MGQRSAIFNLDCTAEALYNLARNSEPQSCAWHVGPFAGLAPIEACEKLITFIRTNTGSCIHDNKSYLSGMFVGIKPCYNANFAVLRRIVNGIGEQDTDDLSDESLIA